MTATDDTRRVGATPQHAPLYRERVQFPETPILSDLILELSDARRNAEENAEAVATLLADLEALHEPDAYGECPTCQSYAPCPSLLVLRREVTLDDAFAAIRDNQPLVDPADTETTTPAVPSLQELLDTPAPMIDRVFDRLIGRSPAGGSDRG